MLGGERRGQRDSRAVGQQTDSTENPGAISGEGCSVRVCLAETNMTAFLNPCCFLYSCRCQGAVGGSATDGALHSGCVWGSTANCCVCATGRGPEDRALRDSDHRAIWAIPGASAHRLSSLTFRPTELTPTLIILLILACR